MKSTLTLPDGTMIRLNAESKLRYPKKFTGQTRKVYLEGEAFFDVVKNPKMPFIIETGNINTKVLGTSFNIKSEEGYNKVQVTVVSGLVEVEEKTSKSKIKLKPNEAGIYDSDGTGIQKQKIADLGDIVGWKEGILSFKANSFDEVCNKIEKWYGVEIVLPKDFEYPGIYNGTFKNKTLKKVLEGMTYALNLDYEIKEKQVFLNNK